MEGGIKHCACCSPSVQSRGEGEGGKLLTHSLFHKREQGTPTIMEHQVSSGHLSQSPTVPALYVVPLKETPATF